jgi:hypothetical protein
MSTGRTILALLVSLSVAMLPVAAGAGVSSKSPDRADMPVTEDMSMTHDMSIADDTSMTEGMHDCCPPMANPCDHAMDDCGSMAGCVLKSFSFAGTSSSIIVFPATFAKMIAPLEHNPFSSQTSAPPFRPPRV